MTSAVTATRTRLALAVAAIATAAAAVLYGAQIAAAISVRDEMRRTCDPHPPLQIAQYFWVTMLLSAVGVVAAIVVLASTRRRLTLFAGVVLLLTCGLLFLLGWYGFSARNDTLGPLCSNL
ncbi:hypothetical protein ACQ7HM_10525 [Williamsia sp. MIQD14]|uniref:hypothetical protein n=1 Tax=Williamsia sp. MIQD14 TaxID=3425703 RepID=UPI003DA16888